MNTYHFMYNKDSKGQARWSDVKSTDVYRSTTNSNRVNIAINLQNTTNERHKPVSYNEGNFTITMDKNEAIELINRLMQEIEG